MVSCLWKFLNIRRNDSSKIPLFVVGCQRSGSTMILNVLSRSPECRVYHEGNSAAFDHFRLRADQTIQRLINKGRQRVVVFKPLNDSQRAKRLLEVYMNARAIWVYRQYQDVVKSSVRKWGSAQKEILLGISEGCERIPGQDAISERMSPETMCLVKKLCSEDMTAEDGAGLHWYVRNLIYWELHDDPRVLLVRYEDLVKRPEGRFLEVFELIGCKFRQEYVSDIYDSSIGTGEAASINGEIKGLCEEMTARLRRKTMTKIS